MAKNTTANKDVLRVLRMVALGYPQTELGVACQGTALESSTVKARDKAFLFMSGIGPSYTVRLKLCQSQSEAMQLAANEPGRYKVGTHGWTTISFSDSEPPPIELMKRWIDESYRLIADKKLLAMLS
jgi:predicted DNA-binding protein (MmcQ/YjbR family)